MTRILAPLQEDFQGYLLTTMRAMHPHVPRSAQVSAEERLASTPTLIACGCWRRSARTTPACTPFWATHNFDAMGRAYIAAHRQRISH